MRIAFPAMDGKQVVVTISEGKAFLAFDGKLAEMRINDACELGAWLFNNTASKCSYDELDCSCGKVKLKTADEAVSLHGHIHSVRICSQ